MLIAYHSNQHELLQMLLTKLLEQAPAENIFMQETILVANSSMAQWVQMQLADHFGIAANINFTFPETFMKHLAMQLLPIAAEEVHYLDQQALCWQLITLLQRHQKDKQFAPLANYLKIDQQQRKLYQLANQLRDLFEHYCIYRPDWLHIWEQGATVPQLNTDQQWQAELWRRLVEEWQQHVPRMVYHGQLYQQLATYLQSAHADLTPYFSNNPRRIFIFSIAALPPLFWKIVHYLSQHLDLHWLGFNPCRFYWGDLHTCKNHTYTSNQNTIDPESTLRPPPPTAQRFEDRKPLFDSDQPLLAAWGRQKSEQLTLLAQCDPIEIDAMVDIVPNTLLQSLQHDLLERQCSTGSSSSPPWHTLHPEECSLSLHACPTPIREVEVLHDNLLTLLAADPTLEPRHIAVMVPNLQQYAPYIQAIFSKAPLERYLPFSIAQQRKHPAMVKTFLKLLQLPSIRCQIDEVLSLLELPEIASRFSIQEEQLPLLRSWVQTSGICWGLEEEEQIFPQPGMLQFPSWQFGLKRMLLGYAMHSETGPFQGVLPLDATAGLAAELIGHLANFLEQLGTWRQQLRKMRTLLEWKPYCHALCNDFFSPETKKENLSLFIEQQWECCISHGAAFHTEPVAITLIHDMLTTQFDQALHNELPFPGVINFCTPALLSTIPYKVLCLLGMNDDCYPRRATPVSFDLISVHPRFGDRHRYYDDCARFLETMLIPKILYVSYGHHHSQEGQQQLPSILIKELLDYIGRYYRLAEDADLPYQENRKRISQQLITEHPAAPFDPCYFQYNARWPSYAQEWLPLIQEQPKRATAFTQSALPVLPPPTELTLNRLQAFYRHPVRTFFQQRLQLFFTPPPEKLPIDEPFTVSPHDRYRIGVQLLDTLVYHRSAQALYQRLSAAGKLPLGPFGALFWQQQQQQLRPIATRLHGKVNASIEEEFELATGGLRLIGRLPTVQKGVHIRWKPVALQFSHGFDLWIEHLIYSALGITVTSQLHGCQNSYFSFAPLPGDRAHQLLDNLLTGWLQGNQQPLFLVPKCGWAWLQTMYEPKTQQLYSTLTVQKRAEQKLRQAWQGDRHRRGACMDPYHQRLCQELSEHALTTITTLTQRFLLPCVHQRQIKRV